MQQHKEAFFFRNWNDEECSAQQSHRYLTPLLSRAREKPSHFQLLYSLTVDPVSKYTMEGIQSNTHAHTFSFYKSPRFNYVCVCVFICVQEGGSRADVDLRNFLSLSVSEWLPSWSKAHSLCAWLICRHSSPWESESPLFKTLVQFNDQCSCHRDWLRRLLPVHQYWHYS